MKNKMGGHVARMGEIKKKRKKFRLESPRGTGHSDYLGVDGRIILKWISGKQC
jgi:hypothetical protein